LEGFNGRDHCREEPGALIVGNAFHLDVVGHAGLAVDASGEGVLDVEKFGVRAEGADGGVDENIDAGFDGLAEALVFDLDAVVAWLKAGEGIVAALVGSGDLGNAGADFGEGNLSIGEGGSGGVSNCSDEGAGDGLRECERGTEEERGQANEVARHAFPVRPGMGPGKGHLTGNPEGIVGRALLPARGRRALEG
jgi:hypothetical protein